MIGACSKADEAKQGDAAAAQDAVVVQDEMPTEANDTASALSTDWAGKWTGVEGMYVTITSKGAGKFSLDMQSDLDTKGVYEGTDIDEGIQFKRGGETLVLRRSSGHATGLKWLAGKKDCLMVKAGEGYCRD